MRHLQLCRHVTEAHDPPAGKHAAIPDPAAFLKDIEDTKALVQLIHDRKNKNSTKQVVPAAKAAKGRA